MIVHSIVLAVTKAFVQGLFSLVISTMFTLVCTNITARNVAKISLILAILKSTCLSIQNGKFGLDAQCVFVDLRARKPSSATTSVPILTTW
mmetsp:Transcript_19940/g.29845  ORF Transcript_19940/g.29845 Transcript_19940/m.29845 type:complete len:91 (-) Transcript_19940:65-337(-)